MVEEANYQPPELTLLGEEHVRRYQETDGEVGYLWNGVPILLLTTKGRKTGKPRTTPLIFARDGERYLIVASQGGAPTHPLWYLNLLETPEVTMQVRSKHYRAIARTPSDDEKPRVWQLVTETWPNYDVYQTRTDRVIPVVSLEPIGELEGADAQSNQ
jgi:deazaflavin-dependent oxidoreductase (nitroreductase family)